MEEMLAVDIDVFVVKGLAAGLSVSEIVGLAFSVGHEIGHEAGHECEASQSQPQEAETRVGFGGYL